MRGAADRSKATDAQSLTPPRRSETKNLEDPPGLLAFVAVDRAAHLTLREGRGRALFRLAAMTGMRRGEVCGIRWQDVDLDKGRLGLRQQLNVVRSPGAPNGGLVFSERTKTDHGRRSIDLDPATVTVLKTQAKRQKEQRLLMGAGWSNVHDLVFTKPDGSPLDPESVAKVFDRRVARAGLPRLRFHGLRH